MRYEHRSVPVRPTNGEGEVTFRVDDLQDLVLQVTGTFTATLALMGQAAPGGPWLKIGSDISAAGWVSIPHPVYALRLDTTAYTSAPEIVLAGRNHRGE
jgi:hypothetical protein